MYNASYNDYELIYLVSEGSEQALDLLYHKYYIYINKVVSGYRIPRYKKDDLVQEGVNVFFSCVKNYNPYKYNKTFYNYFKFALERQLYKVVNNSTYYSTKLILTDNNFKDETDCQSILIRSYREMLENDLDKEIFDKCLVEGLSLATFAKIKGIDYKKVYYRAKCICEQLKKY